MAHINWIKGELRGKLGEVVGESWRGINYVKPYTKPKNPNTPSQQEVRATFRRISLICKHIRTLLETYTRPKQHKMTAYNYVIHLNKAMFDKPDDKWDPSEFRFFSGDLPSANITAATFNATTFQATVTWSATTGEATDKAFIIVYNNADYKVVHATDINRSAGTATIDASIFAGTSDYSDIYAYLAFYRINADGSGLNSENTVLKVVKN